MALQPWVATDISVTPTPGITIAPGDVRVLSFDASKAYTTYDVALRVYGSETEITPAPTGSPTTGNKIGVTVGPLDEDVTYVLLVSFSDGTETWSGTLVIECRVE